MLQECPLWNSQLHSSSGLSLDLRLHASREVVAPRVPSPPQTRGRPARAMKCQGCQSAKATVWVSESEAALCSGCSYVMGDVTRFQLCALCDCNPARIFCHNDNAALCDGCDADIHLSNPLALRHERVALEPMSAETVKVRS